MANLQVVRVLWTGFPGAPGYSTFYCINATAALPALHDMFVGFSSVIPIDVTISFPTSGDIIDPLTGGLVGAWSAGAETDVPGAGSGGYAAPAGFMCRWETGSILDGRRLIGRTYIVPAISSLFAADGSLDDSQLTTLRGYVSSFLAAVDGTLVVWHRPKGARAGGYTAVNSGTIPDEAVVLRSRRD